MHYICDESIDLFDIFLVAILGRSLTFKNLLRRT